MEGPTQLSVPVESQLGRYKGNLRENDKENETEREPKRRRDIERGGEKRRERERVRVREREEHNERKRETERKRKKEHERVRHSKCLFVPSRAPDPSDNGPRRGVRRQSTQSLWHERLPVLLL